jgi:hypothetical protein
MAVSVKSVDKINSSKSLLLQNGLDMAIVKD